MLTQIADTVRGLSADAVEKANSGHPGLPIGCADIGALLYGKVMKYDPTQPEWPDRDRFILSAGHGSMLVYSLLHLAGFEVSLDDLKSFRQLGSKTPGHPEYGETPGVETTTGPLGQGFANAVGMAIAERMLAQRFNTEGHTIVDHYTYTLLGDGCMMEGISSEAASLAGHLGLGKLIAIYDDNEISIGGSTDITFTESVADRFKAYNWHVIEGVDGHDLKALEEAVKEAKEANDKPSLIIAKTKIAFGAPTKEGSSSAHGAPLGEEEIRGLKKNIGFPEDKEFYIPDEVKEFFKDHTEKLKKEREEWEKAFTEWAEENPDLKEEWDKAHNLELPGDLEETINNLEIKTPVATRKASGETLRKIADEIPYLVGGSADLAPSNKTYLDKYGEIQKDSFDGRNFRFGVREHAMGAIVNGLSLHKGVRPFCATFLVFSDYMRPAIRMAALMKQPVIYVFTHDSVYVGEDGPTHQPIEHVEALRVIPNLKVLRPADAEETKAAWLEAVKRTDGPTALVLTRQGLPHIEKEEGIVGFKRGGYIVHKEKGDRTDAVLMASGSEVSLAVEVAKLLEEKGKEVRVVSVPERREFVNQGTEYIEEVLGKDTFRVVLEAGVGNGWYRLLGHKCHVVSLEDFGMSGPGEEVARELGFDAEKIASDILGNYERL
ncbi:transketolase [Halothermothrix orenii]|uniref:Transketolase n=1 Tax=Halothermothrix orenii (strain H 168 / OCM 544 / DSM 9562) TaxID=373903 RepID=B8D1L3_HALOH|nr:transketolase [Halothermothrix orenii]ACL69090.1 transketolase [Halothermothrix orenii H 168]